MKKKTKKEKLSLSSTLFFFLSPLSPSLILSREERKRRIGALVAQKESSERGRGTEKER